MKTLSFQLVIFIFLCFPFKLFSQDVVSFSAPDTVCTGEVLDVEYTGTVGEDFCWISSPLFNEPPFVRDVVGFPFGKKPHFSDVIKSDGAYHIFVGLSTDVDGSNGNLVRLDFGNSLENEPVQNVLEIGAISYGQEGVQIIKENDTWWGFLIGYQNIVRLNFGNDITNLPTIESLGNIGNFEFPHDLFITKENQEWIGIYIDKENNSISRLLFGNSLANNPTQNLIPSNSLDKPTGHFPIKSEGNWYLFVTNERSNTLTRFDFGNSLLGNPAEVNIGDLGVLNEPRDISIFYICNQYCGFVLNKGDGSIIKLDFNNSIENTPVLFTLGNLSGYSFSHSITEGYLSENALHFFFSNVETNDYKDLVFPFGGDNPVICTNDPMPPPIAYDSFGIQTLLLVVDEGMPYQSSACKQVLVEYSPPLNLGNDTTICFGNTLLLKSEYEETIWNGQEIGNEFLVIEEGTYQAEITDGNCTSKDSIFIAIEDCEQCFVLPNVFTPNDDLVNDFFKPILDCPATINNFSFQIFNRWGNVVFKTNDFNVGWDGKQNGKNALSDVYVWKMRYSIQVNEMILDKSEKGDVTLIR